MKNRGLTALLALALVGARIASAQSLADDPRVAQRLELARVWLEGAARLRPDPGRLGRPRPRSAGAVERRLRRGRPGAPGAGRDRRDHLQHLLDLQALHEHRGDAAARRGPPSPRRPREAPPALVRHEAQRGRGRDRDRGPAHPCLGPAPRVGLRLLVAPRLRLSQPASRSSRGSRSRSLSTPRSGPSSTRTSASAWPARSCRPRRASPTTPTRARASWTPWACRAPAPRCRRRSGGGGWPPAYSALDRSGKRQPVPFFTARGIAPAAGYASTATDLAHFASWQFRLLEKGGEEVLRATTLREMYRIHWAEPDLETLWGLGLRSVALRRQDVRRARRRLPGL